jgi:hypothetical protein
MPQLPNARQLLATMKTFGYREKAALVVGHDLCPAQLLYGIDAETALQQQL